MEQTLKTIFFLDADYGDIDTAEKIVELLEKCREAAAADLEFQAIVQQCIDRKGQSPLLTGEKTLLQLASYAKCTDGILYGLPLILNQNGEKYLYLR